MFNFHDTSHTNASSTASKLREDAYLASHIDELKDKMRILQNDRKANIDVLEANKVANKEDIHRLRDENKEFRQRLAQLQRTVVQDSDKDELKHLEREIENVRRELDDSKLKSTRVKKVLDVESDKIRSLELDSQRPHMEDNEHTRRIRILENKLDKAMIKYNEAQSIKKTYEQIVKRLQEERIGYDNQLSIMERTLYAKKRDYDELLVLSGDSLHAKELSMNELERVKAGYEEERKRREKELKERFQVIQLRKQMLFKIKEREKLRLQLEEEYGRSTQEAQDIAMQQILTEKLQQKNKIEIFENAFRKIKEATGVSDVNEVINKIISQESTTENLMILTQENQKKIEVLLDEKTEYKKKVEEMKYNGISGGIRRKLVDDSEDQLSSSTSRLERNRVRYDKLNKLLISIKAGIHHLFEKLQLVRYDDVVMQYSTSVDDERSIKGMGSIAGSGVIAAMSMKQGSGMMELNDDNIIDVLSEQEQILSILSNLVMQGEEQQAILLQQQADNDKEGYFAHHHNISCTSGVEASQATESLSYTSYDEHGMMTSNRPYNQRIELPVDDMIHNHSRRSSSNNILENFNEMSLFNNTYHKSSEYDHDHDEEEITRDVVKKQSSQFLSVMDKKKKKLSSSSNIVSKK